MKIFALQLKMAKKKSKIFLFIALIINLISTAPKERTYASGVSRTSSECTVFEDDDNESAHIITPSPSERGSLALPWPGYDEELPDMPSANQGCLPWPGYDEELPDMTSANQACRIFIRKNRIEDCDFYSFNGLEWRPVPPTRLVTAPNNITYSLDATYFPINADKLPCHNV